MEALTLQQLAASSDELDRDVRGTADIDRFCSSSDWILPAAIELMPPREPFISRGDDGWILMMRGRHGQGWRYLEPLEASWGLACPLIGPDPVAISDRFIELIRQRENDWEVMLMSGLPVGAPIHQVVMRRLSAHYEVMRQSTTIRHVASLAGGLDGFLGRRSRNFRRSLARADRRARAAGVEFEPCHVTDPDEADALFERILAVERRSWKGRAEVGINVGSFGEFYRRMIRRLVAGGRQRAWFARQGGRDIAYVFGGCLQRSYRGLQMSYDDHYRELALGNLCQLRQLEELCDSGCDSYDLGTGLEYKHRWAEQIVESDVLIVLKL